MTLHTINAEGFSAVADAFAEDDAEGLWFLSMVGSQTALKAIWAALLKQPADPVWLIRGTEGALSGGYRRCSVPYETLGTWTTQLTRLPSSGGYHAMVYPRLAEYLYERDDFLLVVRLADEAPQLHHRFLDRRIPLPLHPGWSDWLWKRGLRTGEVEALKGEGILAYRCRPDVASLRADLAASVSVGELVVPSGD